MDDVYRLAPPRKKGLLSLVFSRFSIIAILILLQVFIYIYIYGWLVHLIPFFTAFMVIFTVIMIFYLFNNSMDYSAKLTWMLVLAVFHVPGAIFLLFTQTNIGYRKLAKRENALIRHTRSAIPQSQTVLDELEKDGSGTDDLVRYLNRSGCFPVYDNTEVTYFPIGEDKFDAMLKELAAAEKFIFMEYFIVEEGYMWGKILEILVEKAAQGVEVRVMYDGMCEMSTIPPDYFKLLQEKGIKAKAFSPIKPLLSSHYNYRDHRKILVIDGEVAFNGGVNLADEYINRIERFGHWKDTAVMLKGEAVKSFTLMFLQMWNITEKDAQFDQWLVDNRKAPEHPSGYVIPYGDSPLDSKKVGAAVYTDIINRANNYVHIMTPYLILDGELEGAIKYAAERGVEVKIILPGIPDKKTAYALAKSHYKRLISSGVEIYEYTPGFVHAKVFISDGWKATVGTINLDYRSLYHHFECATYLYKTDCIPDIEADFQDTLTKCRKVTFKSIKEEKLSYKIMGALLKLIAPLM
ncbi:MAG: cardiolipin synthase [Ruminococcus sp.]|uniref:cardiolipin synthase n=1 Tax=Ruminococcus sp. TaxID=41978 RepID=UPI002872BDCE|nr:cardiolipin synthase [Ruminococcus sp.]MBQ3285485.1 cardiolipin synthase [Ruminococcus sp.]